MGYRCTENQVQSLQFFSLFSPHLTVFTLFFNTSKNVGLIFFLTDDIKLIKTTKDMLTNTDKSRNIYKASSENYKKYLVENITKTYKKSNKARVNSINKDTKKLAEKLKIADRMERMEESEAYITVKDHREDFPQQPSFRLINPSKLN